MKRGSIRLILTKNLNMNKLCAKMVQKCFRSKKFCSELPARLLEEPNILVKTKYLWWGLGLFMDNLEIQYQSLKWKSSDWLKLKMCKTSMGRTTLMCCQLQNRWVFFYFEGICLIQYMPQDIMMNEEAYTEVLCSIFHCVSHEKDQHCSMRHGSSTTIMSNCTLLTLCNKAQWKSVLKCKPIPAVEPCNSHFIPRMQVCHFFHIMNFMLPLQNISSGYSQHLITTPCSLSSTG